MHTYRERKPDRVFVLVKMERTNSLTMLGRQAAITASRQVGQASARRSLATQHKAKDMWQEIISGSASDPQALADKYQPILDGL